MNAGKKMLISSQVARFASMIYVLKELYRVSDDETMNELTPHIIDTLMVVHYGLDDLFLQLEELK